MKSILTQGFAAMLLFFFAKVDAQITPTVKNTTKDHKRQCIGYITQWDAWKGANNGIPANAYNHLNIDYSQYTILNFSFFGVAKDGSLHSADFRNKNIYKDGVDQDPAKLVNDDIYSSWDEFFLKGDVQIFWTIDDYLKGLGYVDNGNNTWKNTNTGDSGSLANGIVEVKKDAAFPGIFKIAHDRGVKVMASIGGWSMCKHYGAVAADPAKRKKFTDDCKKLIAMGFDGIDIDWEYPGRAGMNFTGKPADFENFAILIEDIRAAIGSDKLISAAFSPVIKPNEFDWVRLDKSMDYFNMMTYDYNGGWSNIAGHNSPLYDYPNEEFAGLSLKATLDSLVKRNANLKKVNLGGAFYGRGVVCEGTAGLNVKTVKQNVTVQPDGPISTAADYDNFKLDVWDGTPNYSYIINNTSSWTEKWDNDAFVPYRTNGKYFLSYDNVKSIGAKAEFIKENDLAGIIIWQVFGDLMDMSSSVTQKGKLPFCAKTTSPLINEINEVFAGKVVPLNVHGEDGNLAAVIYPNPSNGEFVIDLKDGSQHNEVSIFNLSGQELYKQTSAAARINANAGNLAKGIYIVRIVNDKRVINSKISIE